MSSVLNMLSSGEQKTCTGGVKRRKQIMGGEQDESIKVEKENDEKETMLCSDMELQ